MKTSCEFSNAKKFESESVLVQSVKGHLSGEGYRVRLEVSNMGQSIDMVATRSRWVMAVEAKRNNWRRALRQCKAHAVVADYITVALGLQKVPLELAAVLQENGWGLLMPHGSWGQWIWAIRPKRNQRVWKPQRRRFAEHLRSVRYAN